MGETTTVYSIAQQLNKPMLLAPPPPCPLQHGHDHHEGKCDHSSHDHGAKEESGHDHGHGHEHKEEEVPAWKKRALDADPNAAPFGGSWGDEMQVDATKK